MVTYSDLIQTGILVEMCIRDRDTGNVYVGTTTGNVHVNPTGGTADQAAKLSTPRQFSASGDASAPAVQFDGTQNVAPVSYTHLDVYKRQGGRGAIQRGGVRYPGRHLGPAQRPRRRTKPGTL